jgi:hypothetical protein
VHPRDSAIAAQRLETKAGFTFDRVSGAWDTFLLGLS